MQSDLVVSNVVIPPVVAAPCPTTIDVEIANVGLAPAPFPISVCVAVFEDPEGGPASQYLNWARSTESTQLPPQGRITVQFVVAFPCVSQAWLRATADCLQRVPNNARNNPSQLVLVQRIGAAPWLATSLRVGLRDSMGGITWDPTQLCPASALLVEATIANRGCAAAPASVAEMELSPPGGTALTMMKHVTPAIGPARAGIPTSVTAPFFTRVPSIPHAPPLPFLRIKVCADTTNVVTGQCDRASLCSEIALPVVTAQPGPPSVLFSVDAEIRPGESARVTWSIQNTCLDLGSVTATIQFAGVDIYTSGSLPAPPLGSAGERGATIPKVTNPAIASAFYQIGTRTLDLRIDAAGNDPGPYTATAVMTVVRETVDATLWTWPGGSIAASWKVDYPVVGTLTNRSVAAMTPMAINIRERLVTAPGTSAGVLSPADPFSKSPIPSGRSLTAGRARINQRWPWTNGPDWSLTGPTSLTFSYTAEFDLNDEYGNAYSTVVSAPRTVVVSVSSTKLGFQTAANSQASAAGTSFLFAAAIVFVNPVAAAAALELAWLMWGLSIWNGAQALDPPVPDFRYQEPVELAPPTERAPIEAGDTLTAIGRMVDLMTRMRIAEEALGKTHEKLLGAWIDRATESLQAQASRYREAGQMLSRSAALLPDVAAEAARRVSQDEAFSPARLEEALDRLRAQGAPEELQARAREAGLPEEALPTLERAARELASVPDLPVLLEHLSAALCAVAQDIESEAPAVLALADS